MELRGNNGELLMIERSWLKGGTGLKKIRERLATRLAHEDLLLNITIKVWGYSAADQGWVTYDDWRTFINELHELDGSRQGTATLAGVSHADYRIIFKSTDHSGHMAVTGFLGDFSPDEFPLKLEFGFSFDPGMLTSIVHALDELGH
jgi:hypothetical protein